MARLGDKVEPFIVKRIRELREEKMMSRQELAEASGMSVNTICKYEIGTRIPRPESQRKLLKAFGVDTWFDNTPTPFTIKEINDLKYTCVLDLLTTEEAIYAGSSDVRVYISRKDYDKYKPAKVDVVINTKG